MTYTTGILFSVRSVPLWGSCYAQRLIGVASRREERTLVLKIREHSMSVESSLNLTPTLSKVSEREHKSCFPPPVFGGTKGVRFRVYLQN
jgi:hypothetical protein